MTNTHDEQKPLSEGMLQAMEDARTGRGYSMKEPINTTDEWLWTDWFSDPQGFEDAGGAWSRKWCCALGLEFIDPYSDRIHPRRHQPKEQS